MWCSQGGIHSKANLAKKYILKDMREMFLEIPYIFFTTRLNHMYRNLPIFFLIFFQFLALRKFVNHWIWDRKFPKKILH
jgi:hypothetical protein